MLYENPKDRWEQMLNVIACIGKEMRVLLNTAIAVFKGSSSSEDGASGRVPAPKAGDQDKVLKGDGTWTDISETYATKSELSSHTHSYLPLSGGTVSGNLTVTGTTNSGTFKATSDVRLKSDIKKITTDLSSLSAYRYRLNSDGKLHVGLIAQEVEKVIPEAVSEGQGGWKSLDYNAVVATLVGEVNSLKARISELEKRK